MATTHSAAQGINNLSTLIKRLEAATSRLEDIASSAGSPEQPHAAGAAATSSAVAASSSAPESTSLPKDGSQAPAPPPPATPLPPTVIAMDELLNGEVKSFVSASEGIDALVEEQASSVAKAFADQRRFLLVTTRAKKPDLQSPPTYNALLMDLQQDMGSVGDIRDSHRGSPMKEHLAMVGEGISALQWLLMDSKPADWVGDVTGGAQMYGNRVLKAYKETDQKHVKFVQSYYALLKALQAYVKQHYPTGITWNNSGVDAIEAYRAAGEAPQTNGIPPAAPPPPSSGAPPPPPPPLPVFDNVPAPPPPPPGSAPKAAAGSDMGAVFDQLNRGESVTSGLKKVDQSQMTHKNPSLRAGSTVSESRSKSPGPNVKPKPASMRQNSTTSSTKTAIATKPSPKKELDGNKWLIENWDSPSPPIEVEVSLTQSLLITNCKSTTIILKGKANAISIDNSPRVQILIESLVSSIDVIKSSNFAVQVTGALPTILLDQVDGASIYLGKESLATEVFTSKCSGVNIVLPPVREEDDSVEVPTPEQIRTFIKDGRVLSEIVEYAG